MEHMTVTWVPHVQIRQEASLANVNQVTMGMEKHAEVRPRGPQRWI